MPRKPTLFILAAFAVAPLPLSGPSWAASSDAVSMPVEAPPLPLPAPMWGHPPEAVRTAVAALHDACAAWPKQVPTAVEPSYPPAVMDDAPYVSACKYALDAESFSQPYMLAGGALGAAAAGIAFVAFKAAYVFLFGLIDAMGRSLSALQDRRRRRANGWVD